MEIRNFLKITSTNYQNILNNEIFNQLVKTANREASPVDFIWGIGLSQDIKEAADPFKWKGPNLLGFALMEVRDLLKK